MNSRPVEKSTQGRTSQGINEMIFGRKKMQQNIDPALAAKELRSEIERAVDKARAQHVRHYTIEQVLQDAATTVRVKHAASTPL